MSFRLDPTTACDGELRRVILFQIAHVRQQALSLSENPLKAPHEARKSIKRIRAVLRLARSADEHFYRAENARWRDISAGLAGPRETAALIETVDRFIVEFANSDNRSTLLTLRAHLAMRLDLLVADGGSLKAAGQACIQGCDVGANAIAAWPLPPGPKAGAHLLAKGAKRGWKEAETARKKAGRRGAEDDFHALRKAVKSHGTQLALLQDVWPGPLRRRRKGLEELGETLGELNDIYVMQSQIATGAISIDFDTEGHMARLLKQKKLELCRRSLAEAKLLFGDPPRGLKAAFASTMAEARAKTGKAA